jgi:hypothetical protein
MVSEAVAKSQVFSHKKKSIVIRLKLLKVIKEAISGNQNEPLILPGYRIIN